MSLLLRPGLRIINANADNYSWMASASVLLPDGITHNPTSGLYVGTTVNTAEPIWASEQTLTLTGTATTDLATLQTLANSIASTMVANTRILIPAGADRLKGHFVAPVNNSGYWLGLYSANHASLPASDDGSWRGSAANMVTPSDVSNLVEWTALNTDPVLTIADGAQKLYVRGMAFNNKTHVVQSAMIDLRSSDATDTDTYCSDIIFNGNTFDGGDSASAQYTNRFFEFAGNRIACVNGHMDHVGLTGYDSQGIAISIGLDRFKVDNMYMRISGDSENLMSGGFQVPGTGTSLLPRNGQVTGCDLTKDTWGLHKNHFELKMGEKILFDGNWCHVNNAGGQQSGNILLYATDQYGDNLAVTTRHITITNNKIWDGCHGISVSSGQYYGPDAGPPAHNGTLEPDEHPHHFHIVNNLIFGMTTPALNTGGCLGLSGISIYNITAKWNTFIGDPGRTYARAFLYGAGDGTTPKMTEIHVDENVMTSRDAVGGDYGNTQIFLGRSEAAFYLQVSGSNSFGGNLWHDNDAGRYPNQTRVNLIADMGFADYAGNDFALTSGPGVGSGPNGQNKGVQFAIFNTLMTMRV